MRIRPAVLCSLIVLTTFAAAACGSGSAGSSGPSSSPPQPSTTKATSHGSSQASPTQSAVAVQSPVPVESNPPGDIPDNTQFIPFHSASGHFVVRVPEGWSRRNTKSSVTFTDKLNTVEVTWAPGRSAPTPATARSRDVPKLHRSVLAFALSHILTCAPFCTIPYTTAPITDSIPTHAVVITFKGNSQRNAVTGKQYRLEELRFEFFHNGEEADLTLSGPVGSDNVDPWRLVSESFKWG
jgi:hypothetical protein